MVEVSVEGAVVAGDLPTRVEGWGTALLAALDLREVELSVALTDDAVVRALNAQFRGRDEATDVLSFPQDDDGAAPGASFGPRLLGDVIISLETAGRQAADFGHPVDLEVAVLLVHGVLHLCGHDHDAPDDAAAMRAEEQRLLSTLDVGAAGLVARAVAD